MNTPRISAIAAVGLNNELGKNGDLIWKFKADFERMKSLVKNKPLIMGRKTYESIGRELPYSPSIVITRQGDYQSPFEPTKHTHVVQSLEEALTVAKDFRTDEIIIFGGASVYGEALPITQRLYMTVIGESDDQADSFFPAYDDYTHIVAESVVIEDSTKLSFLTLERP